MGASAPFPLANPFQPQFLLLSELAQYGLPDPLTQADVMGLVQRASSMIDQYCGRTDLDGNGSLVYTTYTQRVKLPVGRNIFRVAFRPLVGLPTTVAVQLAASGAAGVNFYYTGFLPSTQNIKSGPSNPLATTSLSPLISASGRYGYARRAQSQIYPDLNYAANVLQIASFFGGPPQFTNIDISSCDVDERTGEIWVPAGLYLSQYTEVFITYNSGFDPRSMPSAVKHATALIVRNLLARGGGATALTRFSVGKIQAGFTPRVIDDEVDSLLQPFKTVYAV